MQSDGRSIPKQFFELLVRCGRTFASGEVFDRRSPRSVAIRGGSALWWGRPAVGKSVFSPGMERSHRLIGLAPRFDRHAAVLLRDRCQPPANASSTGVPSTTTTRSEFDSESAGQGFDRGRDQAGCGSGCCPTSRRFAPLTLQGQPHGPSPRVPPQMWGPNSGVVHVRGIFDADRGGTFEDHHGFRPVEVGPSVFTDLDQSGVSFFITEPDNLKGSWRQHHPASL